MTSPTPRRRLGGRQLALGLSWIAFTAVAAVVGVGAVQLAGDSAVRSSAELLPDSGLPAGPPPAPAGSPSASSSASPSPSPSSSAPPPPSPTPEPAPSSPTPSAAPSSEEGREPAGDASRRPSPSEPAGTSRTFRSAGGSITVECSRGVPSLRTHAPAGGYQVGQVERDDDELSVEFVAGARTATIEASCSADGRPVATTAVEVDDDDSGDDDG
ncbi:hypothetical protein GC722_15955 [Auraticoccus sp. F435]|uniref:Septum formation initiator n=1 Tax=Auraticoccus cholistanensis TaxID=2656650 RepID=A0A6A9V1N6_9ACTN|nr:hypothetical protein [Auraticoccus cholistanensis]MVA77499.1 hypothetical protein [Auraticoccus cholistanensis]